MLHIDRVRHPSFNSLFEMPVEIRVVEAPYCEAFNSLFEMLGVLVVGFCGFLSFCVGVCGFLAGVLLAVVVLV